MQNMLIFALIGAVCLLIVTGGFISMTDADPTPANLASGAAVGGALGAAVSYLAEGSFSDMVTPDMKVGLPSF